MKLEVKTLKFQEMVAKSVKGASNNKMIPLTGLIAIKAENNVLKLITTDATNTLIITEKGIGGEDFYAVAPVEILSRLVAKITTESITLDLTPEGLKVIGNGSYIIEIPLNEDGSALKFPEPKEPVDAVESTVTNVAIKTILNANRVALAQTIEIPCLTGYYCDEGVITTDTFKVCSNAVRVFDTKVLLSAEMVDLLNIIDAEKITVLRDAHRIYFVTPTVTVQGPQLEGIDEFPAAAIQAYVETEFKSMVKLPKASIMNILDRLQLFVAPYDKNGLYLTFLENELTLNSKARTGKESIKYTEVVNPQLFTCCIDVELLRSQIAGQESEIVELWFGHPKAIKMTSGKITQIIALLEDDRGAADGSAES